MGKGRERWRRKVGKGKGGNQNRKSRNKERGSTKRDGKNGRERVGGMGDRPSIDC